MSLNVLSDWEEVIGELHSSGDISCSTCFSCGEGEEGDGDGTGEENRSGLKSRFNRLHCREGEFTASVDRSLKEC